MAVEFWQTGMGHHFYEGTMPELVRQVTRLNNTLEKIVTLIEREHTAFLAEHLPPPDGGS